ncbi:MAG: nucleotidyltransferase family protein, partial [Flavobacteriaceae bacterium]
GTANIHDLNQLLNTAPEAHTRVALLSRLHRIRPVVYRVLLETNIPAPIKEQLKNELHAITLHNFAIAQETQRIVNRLQAHDIVVIPYKGVAFSSEFYGDISMRESSDIDLIIDKEKVTNAIQLFEEDGFTVSYFQLPPNGKESYFIENKDLCFDKKTEQHNWHIELHWMITHPRYGAPLPINCFDLPSNQLNDVEHFRATLLHHMVHDGIEYLKTVVDLAQAIVSMDQKRETNQLATHLKSTREYYHTPAIGNAITQLFGINTIAIGAATDQEEKIASNIIDYNLTSTIGKYKRHRIFSLLLHYKRTVSNRTQFIKNNKDKQQFIWKYWTNVIQPQPGDKAVIKLPFLLSWLYIFIRPIRILLRKKEVLN